MCGQIKSKNYSFPKICDFVIFGQKMVAMLDFGPEARGNFRKIVFFAHFMFFGYISKSFRGGKPKIKKLTSYSIPLLLHNKLV